MKNSNSDYENQSKGKAKGTKRRQRPLLSCAECRRLKLKCDRTWPCSSCKKRGCEAICPDGTLQSGNSLSRTAVIANVSSLLSRLQQLESVIVNNGGIVPSPTQPIISSPNEAFSSPPPLNNQYQSVQEDFTDSFGALTLGDSGQAKYVGPSAGSEWLQNDGFASDEETFDNESSPYTNESLDNDFPFTSPINAEVIQQLWSQLPPRYYANHLIDIYYRFSASLYYCVPRSILNEDLINIYDQPLSDVLQPQPHNLARLFMILSLGTYFDINNPPNHRDCHRYYSYAKTLLSASDFMVKSSLAAVQTLHLMGTYLLNRKSTGGDSYWPLLQMKMGIIKGMGLNRDGAKWGFSETLLNERRRTFWESHSMEVFQSICFGRPYSISAKHIDCEFPHDEESIDVNGKDEGYDYHSTKFKLIKILCRISDEIYGVNPPSYETIIQIDRSVREFEKNIPLPLRCRAASLGRNLHNYEVKEDGNIDEKFVLQQHSLALNINECLLYVNRRYFAHALKTYPKNPLESPFSQSFVAVMECCKLIVTLIESIHKLSPHLLTRHWYFYYHLFTCGICAGAVCIISPGSSLASDAWKNLSAAIELCDLPIAKRANSFVPPLKKVKERALSRLNVHIGVDKGIDDSDDEHMVMLGLGSKVVSKGQATIKTPSNVKTKDTKKNDDIYVPDDTDQREIKKSKPSIDNSNNDILNIGNSHFDVTSNDPIYQALLKQSEGSTSTTEMFNSLWEYPHVSNSDFSFLDNINSVNPITNLSNNNNNSNINYDNHNNTTDITNKDVEWSNLMKYIL